jgi:hypothetical protein
VGSDGGLVMHTASLLNWLRLDAYIGDASQYPDQTDLILLAECTHKLHSVFADIVTKAREGYWLKEFVTATVVGRGRYRIPTRAVVGGLEKVEVATTTTGTYYRLREISAVQAEEWEGAISGNPGTPQVFVLQGDQIEMFPTPNAVLPMRMSYYIRPSVLTVSQNNQVWDGLTGGTDRGRITATSVLGVNPVTLTVNTPPNDNAPVTPVPITSAVQSIDVVHADGWHELALVGSTQTLAGNVFTLPNGTDITDVLVGDYVRVADQTDWPCLPDDFHRCLADVAAIKVAVELGLRETNDTLAQNVENDLVRFRSLLVPRVKSEPKTTPVSLKSRGGCWY